MSAENRNKKRAVGDAPRICAVVGLFIAVAILFALGLYFLISAFLPSENEEDGRFTEYVGTVHNPGIGYTSTDWYYAAPNASPVHDTKGDIVLFFIDIGQFSSGVNGTTDADGKYVEGTDYDLDETFFSSLRATFENCRKNGSTIAVRFRYDANGKDNPEPSSFDTVLKHISQIKASKILDDYSDILMFVESGFVGKWGEQHSGKYTSLDHKAQLLGAMLDCVPSPVPVTVRTPDTFARYVGISRAELADYTPEAGSDAARVGLYNDGYLGSNSDLGTFSNREVETSWLGRQTVASYYGGEFSGAIDFAKQFDTYLPENCIPEMYKTHLSYINGNIFELYKDITFDASLDFGTDNSAYYGKSVFDFIRDHLGYRFVLTDSSIGLSESGSMLDVEFSLINKGFANAVKKPFAEVLLENGGRFVRTAVEIDPTQWLSCQTSKTAIRLALPGTLEKGRWNVYLKLSYGNNDMTMFPYRSVRFANSGVFDEGLGANRIGYFDVDGMFGNGNLFGEVGKEFPSHFYDLGGKAIADGKCSSDREWTDSEKITEENGVRLYAKADEKNLYVMSTIGHDSAAPVFNIRATVGGSTYWLYKQSNGFVYFNKEKEIGHIGFELGYGSDMFEFKIPLYLFGLSNGSEITNLSVFVQDSADGWKGKGNIAAPYTVKTDFTVYNSREVLTLNEGESYSAKILTDAEVAAVEWLFDGKPISIGDALTLSSVEEDNGGVYSARVTTKNGNTKVVEILNLTVLDTHGAL